MLAFFSIGGLLGGTTLACLAPRSRYAKQLELVGGLLFVGALALIGFGLAAHF